MQGRSANTRSASMRPAIMRPKRTNIDYILPSSTQQRTTYQTEPFIFFGCWNQIDCKKEYVFRDIVLDYIKENEKEIKQLYIAGDNWYQNAFKRAMYEKNQKHFGDAVFKYYFFEVLKSGYDKIFDLNKETHIALGNHDIDMSKKRKKNKEDPNRNCLFKTQQYYIDQHNNGNKQIAMPTLEYLQQYQVSSTNRRPFSVRAISRRLRDLSLSQHKKHKAITLYDDIGIIRKKRYIMIVINTNKLDNDKYLSKINDKIKNTRLDINKTIFVLGHHPIFSNKDGKIEQLEIGNNETLDSFFNILADNKCIYLCADTHNFSIVKISKGDKSLVQIVSGTGGADPSKISKDIENKASDVNINNYQLHYISVNSYGYTKIHVKSMHEFDVVYTQVISIPNKTATSTVPLQYTYTVSNNNVIHTQSIQLSSSSTLDLYKAQKQQTCNVFEEAFHVNRNMSPLVITNANKTEMCYKKYKFKEKDDDNEGRSFNPLLRRSFNPDIRPKHQISRKTF